MVHVVTFTLSVTLPEILNRRPILDDIVTVNLVSLPDLPGPAQPEAPAPRVEEKAPEPVIKPEAEVKVPVETQAPAPAPVKEVRPVSLKPIKRKVKMADPQKLAEEEARRKQELESQKALDRAREEEARAQRAAEEARSALAEMIRRKEVQPSATSGGRRSTGTRQVTNVAEQIFYAGIYDRVKQFWVLPEMRQWDPSLETRVVVTIRRDGSIAGTVVEKKSGDPFFDQFVMKTLKKSDPLLPIPKVLKKDSIEIGFVFRPGELLSM